MTFELSLILIMVVIMIWMIVTKIFSVLLQITGLPKNIANYQSFSLFTNCGFTTSESETITNNKIRRKISLACMITGNFFSVIIVSLIVNMISSFSLEHGKETYIIALIACGIFVIILLILQLPIIKNFINNVIQGIVNLVVNKAHEENIITIIENIGKNAVVEIHLHKMPSVLDGKTIHESKLKSKYDINILSIKRHKRLINITRNTFVETNDVLLVFGEYSNIVEIFDISKNLKEIEEKKTNKFNEIELIDNYGNKAMVEIKVNLVPLILEEKTLFSSGLKDKFGINIMFIKRNDEVIEVDRNTIVQKNDTIIAFGDYQTIRTLFLY